MASQPTPPSTGGTARTPPAPSAPATPRVCYVQRYIVLVDWWLERVEGEQGKIRVVGTQEMRKGASSSIGNRKVAGRVFRSAPIAKRNDFTKLKTEDGYLIWLARFLNIPRTRENGFSEKVCKCFEMGFPIQWLEVVNPNLEQQNDQAHLESESTANAPRHSVEYYMDKYADSSASFTKPMRYAFTEKDFFSYTGNTDGPYVNLGSMAAPCGLNGGRKDMPESPLTSPEETCSNVQESVQHGSTQIDAREQGIDNRSTSFVSVNQSVGSIYPNSEVDDSIMEPPKIVSVEMEGYRRLRSGKVFGSPSGGPTKRGYKQKKIQSVASSKKMVPNEWAASTADVTSHENGSSAARIIAEVYKKSNDSQNENDKQSTRRGRGRAANCSRTR